MNFSPRRAGNGYNTTRYLSLFSNWPPINAATPRVNLERQWQRFIAIGLFDSAGFSTSRVKVGNHPTGEGDMSQPGAANGGWYTIQKIDMLSRFIYTIIVNKKANVDDVNYRTDFQKVIHLCNKSSIIY